MFSSRFFCWVKWGEDAVLGTYSKLSLIWRDWMTGEMIFCEGFGRGACVGSTSSGASEQNVRRRAPHVWWGASLTDWLQVERHFAAVYGVLAYGRTVPGSWRRSFPFSFITNIVRSYPLWRHRSLRGLFSLFLVEQNLAHRTPYPLWCR